MRDKAAEFQEVVMQDLVRVAFLGVAGVLLAVQFKGQKPEYGVYIEIGRAHV